MNYKNLPFYGQEEFLKKNSPTFLRALLSLLKNITGRNILRIYSGLVVDYDVLRDFLADTRNLLDVCSVLTCEPRVRLPMLVEQFLERINKALALACNPSARLVICFKIANAKSIYMATCAGDQCASQPAALSVASASRYFEVKNGLEKYRHTRAVPSAHGSGGGSTSTSTSTSPSPSTSTSPSGSWSASGGEEAGKVSACGHFSVGQQDGSQRPAIQREELALDDTAAAAAAAAEELGREEEDDAVEEVNVEEVSVMDDESECVWMVEPNKEVSAGATRTRGGRSDGTARPMSADKRRQVIRLLLVVQNYSCGLCSTPLQHETVNVGGGRTVRINFFEVDHIERRQLNRGDVHDITNLQLLCYPCHKKKTLMEKAFIDAFLASKSTKVVDCCIFCHKKMPRSVLQRHMFRHCEGAKQAMAPARPEPLREIEERLGGL